MSTGSGETEVINAVLPLFEESDEDLAPLINSRLYHILMTFNVMQNVDTVFDTCYIALMANTFYHLITQYEKTSWREGILKLLHSTLKVTYSRYKW